MFLNCVTTNSITFTMHIESPACVNVLVSGVLWT